MDEVGEKSVQRAHIPAFIYVVRLYHPLSQQKLCCTASDRSHLEFSELASSNHIWSIQTWILRTSTSWQQLIKLDTDARNDTFLSSERAPPQLLAIDQTKTTVTGSPFRSPHRPYCMSEGLVKLKALSTHMHTVSPDPHSLLSFWKNIWEKYKTKLCQHKLFLINYIRKNLCINNLLISYAWKYKIFA